MVWLVGGTATVVAESKKLRKHLLRLYLKVDSLFRKSAPISPVIATFRKFEKRESV